MKKISLILVLVSLCLGVIAQKVNEHFVWTKEKAEQHIKNRLDSSKWDMELFKEDLELVEKRNENPSKNPITFGAFPVPRYELTKEANFRGMGNYSFNGQDGRIKKVGDKSIVYNTFFTFKNSMNSKYIGDKDCEVFFQVVVLTDYVNPPQKDNFSSHVISRNNPHYIGEGMFKTTHNKIDYTAFVTAARNSYAIVNMRLFDLSLGKTILIAPQKDKSLRSLQINSPNPSYQEIDLFVDKLLERKDVIEFFTKEGNI